MLVSSNNLIKPIKTETQLVKPVSFTANQLPKVSSDNLAKISMENFQAYAIPFAGKGKAEKPGKEVEANWDIDPKALQIYNKLFDKSVQIKKDQLPATWHVDPKKDLDEAVKAVKKEYQGAGLYDGNYIDWNKAGWDNLSKEPLDWEKASDLEIAAFYHAMALAETKDSTWVRRYNETNVPEFLSTYHKTAKFGQLKEYYDYLLDLKAIGINKHPEIGKPSFLDKPVLDEKGNFNLEFCVFDTETTGIDKSLDGDRIVQLGAVKVGKDGVKGNTAVSQFINPEMPIPEGASNVHHITDEMVADKPKMEEVLNDFLNRYLKDQLLVAYNASFDIPMLNNSIQRYNTEAVSKEHEKAMALTLDPFILIQRIHPFVGASKKLSEQYKYLFARNMEGAHDALDDVKGTVDVLKYCCYYLQEHANRPLTVKDLLTFQFGGKVDGLDLQLSKRGYDQTKSFKTSYRLDALVVKNFFDGYLITETSSRKKTNRNVISDLKPIIGEDNAQKLWALRQTDPDSRIKSRDTMEAKLESLEDPLQPYNGMSVEEIIDVIIDKSKYYINNRPVEVWRKNTRTDHLYYGNDLPDVKIIKKVMAERKIEDAKYDGAEGRDLETILKEMESEKA